MKFVLEPKNYADILLAEPGLFLPVTEDGDTPAWKDSEVLGKYPEAVNLMVEQSKYGYLFGFTRRRDPLGDRPDLGREPALPGRAEGHRRGRLAREPPSPGGSRRCSPRRVRYAVSERSLARNYVGPEGSLEDSTFESQTDVRSGFLAGRQNG